MTAKPTLQLPILASLIPPVDPASGAAEAPDPEEVLENAMSLTDRADHRRRRAEAEMRRALHVPDSLRADPDTDSLPPDAPIFHVLVAVSILFLFAPLSALLIPYLDQCDSCIHRGDQCCGWPFGGAGRSACVGCHKPGESCTVCGMVLAAGVIKSKFPSSSLAALAILVADVPVSFTDKKSVVAVVVGDSLRLYQGLSERDRLVAEGQIEYALATLSAEQFRLHDERRIAFIRRHASKIFPTLRYKFSRDAAWDAFEEFIANRESAAKKSKFRRITPAGARAVRNRIRDEPRLHSFRASVTDDVRRPAMLGGTVVGWEELARGVGARITTGWTIDFPTFVKPGEEESLRAAWLAAGGVVPTEDTYTPGASPVRRSSRAIVKSEPDVTLRDDGDDDEEDQEDDEDSDRYDPDERCTSAEASIVDLTHDDEMAGPSSSRPRRRSSTSSSVELTAALLRDFLSPARPDSPIVIDDADDADSLPSRKRRRGSSSRHSPASATTDPANRAFVGIARAMVPRRPEPRLAVAAPPMSACPSGGSGSSYASGWENLPNAVRLEQFLAASSRVPPTSFLVGPPVASLPYSSAVRSEARRVWTGVVGSANDLLAGLAYLRELADRDFALSGETFGAPPGSTTASAPFLGLGGANTLAEVPARAALLTSLLQRFQTPHRPVEDSAMDVDLNDREA